MKISVKSFCADGTVDAIPSKSYVHRILICKFLAGEKIGLGEFRSEDMQATLNCLQNLNDGKNILDCGESGSTLRFLLPLVGAIGGEYEFIGRGKLMQRPNDALFSAFGEHGFRAEQSENIVARGKLTAGEYRIRGDISSQYISGLLMALPVLDGDSKIVLTTPPVSVPYIDITLEVLKNFGIEISKTDYGYFVKGNQKYIDDGFKPEGDWSNAGYFLALGGINGSVTVRRLNKNSIQADGIVYDILKLAGAEVSWEKENLTVRKKELKAFVFDAKNCPDVVPISAVIAACAKGVSVIKNVERLRIKESDRIESTVSMLASFGIRSEYSEGNLYVYGGTPREGNVDSFNDHRIVMSAAVLASVAEGSSVISGAEAVNKSYPTFFEDFCRLGGNAIEL